MLHAELGTQHAQVELKANVMNSGEGFTSNTTLEY